MFDDDPLGTSMVHNEYSTWNVTENLSQFNNTDSGMRVYDYFKLSVTWLVTSLWWFIKVVFSIIIIYPTLVHVFGIPAPISALIQAAIIPIYIMGWVQFRSQRSMKGME